jgi:hypothetical protein
MLPCRANYSGGINIERYDSRKEWKQAIMKSKTEEENKKAETDFYDWWDSVESRMIPMERAAQPRDESNKIHKSNRKSF